MKISVNLQEFKTHQRHVSLNVIEWSQHAACKSVPVDEFYQTEDSKLKRTARRYCILCPVQNQCLYTAIILNEQHGLWGGFTSRQRKVIYRKLVSFYISKGYDFTNWNNKLSSLIYKNTQIQKAADFLQS